jgi:hypothetical protein
MTRQERYANAGGHGSTVVHQHVCIDPVTGLLDPAWEEAWLGIELEDFFSQIVPGLAAELALMIEKRHITAKRRADIVLARRRNAKSNDLDNGTSEQAA